METCNQSLTDAGASSETPKPRQLSTDPKAARMREYMAKRRKSKLVGMTVAEWEKAGCPSPDTGVSESA